MGSCVVLLSMILSTGDLRLGLLNRYFDEATRSGEDLRYCVDVLQQPIRIATVAFADLTGDGREEIVATAYTCHSANAGPDLHEVFRVLADGRLEALAVRTPSAFASRPLFEHLVGNRNWFFYPTETGELVMEFHDRSTRPAGVSPLVLYHRWSGETFELVRGEFRARERCGSRGPECPLREL